MRTKPLKSLATGFLAMATAISLYSIFTLARGGDPWLGTLYLLILAPPLSFAAYLWRNRKPAATCETFADKVSLLLFGLQGAALACWAYDLATTFYAINVARIAYEVNPLGWPLGAAGAFSYYAPTVILTYVLLFKLRAKISVVAAVPMTAVALIMGSMNLSAGAGNFTFFVWTASISADVRINLLALVATFDIMVAAGLAMAHKRRAVHSGKLELGKNR